MSRDFYQLLRTFGGISLEYQRLEEADFTKTAGSSYIPPERGSFRRSDGVRRLQLLSEAPGVIESFQSSTSCELRLPANTVAFDTNDAGDGRLFFIKNSGTTDLLVNDYLGNTLQIMPPSTVIQAVGNDSNNWDIYFKADDIYFDNTSLGWSLVRSTIQKAIEYASTVASDTEGIPRYLALAGHDGYTASGKYLQFFKGVNSNKAPLVLTDPTYLKSISVSFKNSSTATFDIIKNGVTTIETLTVTSALKNYKSGLTISLAAGDDISIKLSSGSATDINFSLFLTVVS